jgi:hypothetical protein
MREGREGLRAQRIRSLFAFVALVARRRYPTGVRHYRSLEEADADRQMWLREHVQRRRRAEGTPTRAKP